MKKQNKAVLLVLSALGASVLASCGGGNEEKEVASIKIVQGSIATTYQLGASVDYNRLEVQTLDSDNKAIKTYLVRDNASLFTYDEIDTSTLTEGKIFTVTYKEDEKTFTDSLTYTVTEKQYELSGWSANSNYTLTVNATVNPKLSSSETTLENGFLKKGKYYIGNNNAANLMPNLDAFDPDSLRPVALTKMPLGVKVTLKKEGEETALKTEDYIENADSFARDGLLKFKEGVLGDFVLTLSFDGVSDIVYRMEVVDAYNVTTGKDLFTLFNSEITDWPYTDQYSTLNVGVKEFKKANDIPDADSLVFQNDITLNKSDVPSCYFWGEDADSESVQGSFKDWVRMIEYKFQENGDAYIYGNSHRFAINDKEDDKDAFPYVTTESKTGAAQKAGEPISTHSNVIYVSFAEGVDPTKCHFIVKDLEAAGNMGVSNESNIAIGGPMFMKSEVTTTFENVNASKFYMVLMGNGSNGTKKIGSTEYALSPTMNVLSCRFRDSFNAAMYLWGAGTINIQKSEFVKAGGPLMFLNPMTEMLHTNGASNFANLRESRIVIDEESFLSNYLAGQGGWFDAYQGASAMAGSLATANMLFESAGMSFLKADTSSGTAVNKFNLIMVNLPISGDEALQLPVNKGGTNVNVYQGDRLIYSTLDGYQEAMIKANAYATATDQASKLAAASDYIHTLGNTFFGNNISFSSVANGTVFATTTEDNEHEFFMVNQDPKSKNYFLCSSEYAIKSAAFSALLTPSDSPIPGANIQAEGYLSVSINGESAQTDGNPANPTAYSGACNYGVLLGGYSKIK